MRAIRGDRALLADGSWRDLGLWVCFNDLAVVDLSTGAEPYRARVDGGDPGQTLGMDLTLGVDAGRGRLSCAIGPVDPRLDGRPPLGTQAWPFRSSSWAASVGGLAEPAGEVVVEVLLIVADPGDVAVGAEQSARSIQCRGGIREVVDPV